MHVTGAKPARETDARDQVTIGFGFTQNNGASFVNQSQNILKQNQSKRKITFAVNRKPLYITIFSNYRLPIAERLCGAVVFVQEAQSKLCG